MVRYENFMDDQKTLKKMGYKLEVSVLVYVDNLIDTDFETIKEHIINITKKACDHMLK